MTEQCLTLWWGCSRCLYKSLSCCCCWGRRCHRDLCYWAWPASACSKVRGDDVNMRVVWNHTPGDSEDCDTKALFKTTNHELSKPQSGVHYHANTTQKCTNTHRHITKHQGQRHCLQTVVPEKQGHIHTLPWALTVMLQFIKEGECSEKMKTKYR